MKKLSHISVPALLIVSLCLSIFIVQPPQVEAAVSNWQQGASIVPRWDTDFSSQSFQQSVTNLRDTGANYVTLIVPYCQNDNSTTEIYLCGNTPTDDSIRSAVNFAHSIGMNVILKLHLESHFGGWRAYINPNDRDRWYQQYSARLNNLASIAEETGTEGMIIGAELISMASHASNPNNTERWQNMISQVRERFSGFLTYSANWGSGDFAEEFPDIQFWPQLDYIGISGYWPLATDQGDPSVEALVGSWAHVRDTKIKPMNQQYGKPVIFTEIGYKSANGAHYEPWNYERNHGYNAEEQRKLYVALFQFWNSEPYFSGVHLWDWSSDPGYGGEGNQDYTAQHKPAQQVMVEWFGSTAPEPEPNPDPEPPQTPGDWTSSATASENTVGNPVTFNATLSTTGNISNAVVDLEVYDNSGSKIHQEFFGNQSFAADQAKQYQTSWTPSTVGTYTFVVGVFNNNWTNNYHWNGNAATVTVGQTPDPEPEPDPDPDEGGFTINSTVTPSQPTVGQTTTITTEVSTESSLSNAIVDVEIYNSSGGRVHQQSFEGQTLNTIAREFDVAWTPSSTGTYAVSVGIFNSNWSTNYYWNSTAATISVGEETTPDPDPEPPTDSYTTNIWWPTDGVSVNGVQPLKAMVEGLDISQYRMYWQVDGDTLNEMSDSQQDYPHKETLVDFTGWSWKGEGPYVINFVSKNLSGATISEKAINLFVR